MASTASRATLHVGAMTCDSCAAHVGAALRRAGLDEPQVDWRAGLATFPWSGTPGEARIAEAVHGAGYLPGELTVAPVRGARVASGPGAADFDLLVLGAGSAAFAAAIKAREAGRTVALVESGTLGGTCVNVGCVPSKALLRAGELAWAAGHHPYHGLATSSGPVDLKALVAAKDDLVAGLRQAKYANLVEDYGFTVLPGHAGFVASDAVEVAGRRITAGAFLIATGASPAIPPIPGLAQAGYLTSSTALGLEQVPQRLAVIGANAIGLELGQFFLHVGSQVTFVDIAETVAPFEEPEVSAALTAYLQGQGATVFTGAGVAAVRRDGDARTLTVTQAGGQTEITVDQVLVATGRRPNTDGLDLAAAGVAVDDRGRVVVNEQLRTTNPLVWAAGDVAAAAQFVYVSAYQGALAAENALAGANRTVDLTGLPRVTFTTPQVAGAGLTEAQARAAGYQVKISVLPLDAVPRALVNRDTHGLVKLVADATTGRLLGASILAESAGEAIQTAVLAIRLGLTTEQLAATFHPYLTMVEGVKLAAQTFTRDVHKLSCCAA